MTSRIIASRARFCVLLALVSACAVRDRTPADTIVVAVDSNPRSLDPRFGTDSLASKIGELVCPGLTARDENGTLIPSLARSWEWKTPTRLSFRLREGYTFSDGSPLESEDVAATVRSILDPATASVFAAALDEIDHVETPSHGEVVFALKYPSAPLLQDLVSPGVMKRGMTKDVVEIPVCAGPYRAVSFRRDEQVELEAWPGWKGEPPATKRIVFRIVPDATIRVLEVAHGSADLVQNDFPPHFLPVLEREPHITIAKADGRNVKYLVFNLKKKPLDDVRVRRAIAAAIDRRSLIDLKLKGLARAADGILAPESGFHPAGLPANDLDLARANALLDDAKLPRAADGMRFSLEYKTSTNETAVAIARILKSDLAKVGIAVTVRPAEWGTFFHDIQQGDFELYTLTSPAIVDPDFLRWMFGTTNIPPAGSLSNRGSYSNAAVDALLDQGAAEIDDAKRAAIYARAQELIAADLPVLPLWYETVVAAESDRLTGYPLSPFASYRGLAKAKKRE